MRAPSRAQPNKSKAHEQVNHTHRPKEEALQHTVHWHPTTNRCPPPHIVQEEEVLQHTVY
jgi:hypothetical protein